MTDLRLVLVFLAALVIALVATVPLPVALAASGLGGRLTAREVHGTIWRGRLEQAALGGVGLGEVSLGLGAGQLLVGGRTLTVVARGGAFEGRGKIVARGGGSGVEAVTGRAPLSMLGAPASVTGVITLKAVAVGFAGGRCRWAVGQISAEVRGLGDQPVVLTGRPACRDAALVIALNGSRSGAPVEVLARLEATGRYNTRVRVSTAEPVLGALLSADGFVSDGSGYSKTNEGRFQ